MTKNNNKQNGFTLIEVMIVVALIGILSAIAFPSYTDYVRKTRRSDAYLMLLSTAQSLERCKTTAYSYESCRFPNGTKTAVADTSEHYTFKLVVAASTYTIRAIAKGSQLNDSDCKILTINQLGITASKNSAGTKSTDCWD